MLLTSQSVIQKYWVINSLPLLIWEAPTICERQFVTALVLRFSKQTITSIVPNSAYIWRKKKEKTHHKAKAMTNTKTLVLQNYPATKTVSIADVFFVFVLFFLPFFFAFFLPFFLFILFFFFFPAFSVSKERWKLHTIQLHLWAMYIGLILMCWIIIDGCGSSALLVNQ